MARNTSKTVPSLRAHERLLLIRKALRLTRQEFAERYGLTYDQLENMERGKQRVIAELCENLATDHPQYGLWLALGDNGFKPSREQLATLRADIEKSTGQKLPPMPNDN